MHGQLLGFFRFEFFYTKLKSLCTRLYCILDTAKMIGQLLVQTLNFPELPKRLMHQVDSIDKAVISDIGGLFIGQSF